MYRLMKDLLCAGVVGAGALWITRHVVRCNRWFDFADKSVITGADGLLGYLRTKEPLVMKTLAKKMLGYALGRTVLASDRALIDEMIVAGGDATFADLAVKIAASRQFRHREGRDDETARPSQ